jgi:hypothetical protein
MPSRWRQYVALKRRYTATKLYDVMAQKVHLRLRPLDIRSLIKYKDPV